MLLQEVGVNICIMEPYWCGTAKKECSGSKVDAAQQGKIAESRETAEKQGRRIRRRGGEVDILEEKSLWKKRKKKKSQVRKIRRNSS